MTEQINEKDVISKKPELLKTVNSNIYYKFKSNSNLIQVMYCCNNGPKSVDEITELYPVKKVVKKVKLSQSNGQPVHAYMQSAAVENVPVSKEIEVTEEIRKSESTIYRYVKELEKNGFLIQAGRRISSTQTSSKILYDRAASMFIPITLGSAVWSSEQANDVANALGMILKRHFENKTPNIDEIKKLFKNYEEEKISLLLDALKEVISHEKLVEPIKELSARDASNFFGELSLLIWITQKEDYYTIFKELKNSFQGQEQEKTQIKELFKIAIEKNHTSDADGKYQDYLFDATNAPALIKIIDDDQWISYFKDENYCAIIDVLRRKKLTLKEIFEKHHSTVKNRIEKENKYHKNKQMKIPKKPKTENTLYKYLKDLKKVGLVVEVGRRVTQGTSFTQILYGRTADIFYYNSTRKQEDYLSSESWKQITTLIGQILLDKLAKSTVNDKKLHQILSEYNRLRSKILYEALASATDPSLFDAMFCFDHDQQVVFINTLGLVEWFLAQKDKKLLRKKLLGCFSN